jgi:hypothetical protein
LIPEHHAARHAPGSPSQGECGSGMSEDLVEC